MTKAENVLSMPDMKDVNAEAAEWVVLLEDGELSAEDRAAFLAWRNASPRNREAFERLAALSGAFDDIAQLEDYAASDDNARLLAHDARMGRVGVFGRRPVLACLAASLGLLVVGSVVLQTSPGWIEQDRDTYHTAIGEQRTIELSDGSTINLNTNSAVEIAYRDGARDIRLIDGEAYFDVTPDKARPFSVWVEGKAVTAVGTAFTVRRLEEKITVTVAQGRVALYAAMSDDDKTRRVEMPSTELVAGQSALLSETVEEVATIGPEKLARKLSWRDGVLAFSGDPLSEVVADVSRYTDIKIEIDDAVLADLPVNGYFKIGEIGEMFEALEIMAGLEAERVGPKHIRLMRPQPS